MPTSFCPACGHENEASVPICRRCGADLVHAGPAAEAPLVLPIRWPVVGLYAVLVVVPLLLTHLVPALRPLALRFQVEKVFRRVEVTDREALARAREALAGDDRLPGHAALVDGQYVYEDGGRILAFAEQEVALSRGGLARLGFPLLFCLLAAVLVVTLHRRRIFREVALAGFAVATVLLLLWLHEVGWRPGRLLRGDLFFLKSDGQQSQMPAPIFVAWSVALVWLGGVLSATLAAIVAEAVARQATCRRCGERYPARPAPPSCPHCRTPVTEPTVAWRWVGIAVAATAVAYVLLVLVAGPRLRFYYHCDYYAPSERCRAALEEDVDLSGPDADWKLFYERHGDPKQLTACRAAFLAAVQRPGTEVHRTLAQRCRMAHLRDLLAQDAPNPADAALGCAVAVLRGAHEDEAAWGACSAADRSKVEVRLARWQPRKSYLVFYHYWRFLLIPAPLFLVAPLILAWRRRRSRSPLATAGAAIPLGWLAATLSGFVLLRLAGFEGAFFVNLQTYIVALILWGVVGFLGAMIGSWLGSRGRNVFADLED
jgi:ribosomal protein L37E